MNALLFGAGGVYLLATAALFAFGANFIYYSALAWRGGREPEPSKAMSCPLPKVTVQLPIYNELYVSARVIEAACLLDYPKDLLQIQVLDDSTDETVAVVAEAVKRAQSRGTNIVHVRRADRSGFKAGALRNGLETATGEFVAIFDADFVPNPDFLLRAMPHFDSADVAFVQARWGHLNRDYSWLTKLQAMAIDAHFTVEQYGRGLRGYWFNFNGTAGIWRRAAIEDAGGWTADTLTEDLDLSYRAHLNGWQGRYLIDLVAPAELPAHFAGFRRQQHRWARGSLECAIKLLPRVWRSSASLGVKVQASAHLLGYTVHLLLFVVTLIYPFVVALSVGYASLSTLFGLAYLFALTSLAPAIFFVTGQRQLGERWWRTLPRVILVAVLGSGLMLNTARAAVQIVSRSQTEFERTAKFGIDEDSDGSTNWKRQRYQLRLDRIVYMEAALGAYGLATAWFAFTTQTWGIMLYAGLFGLGLLAVATASLVESVGVFRNRLARTEQIQKEQTRWATANAE
ncbi:MAG TPA: glycosyltransferase [Actinobacteria bacterium]|nr:glycosyltransferase [Actinomycetota bacterium]